MKIEEAHAPAIEEVSAGDYTVTIDRRIESATFWDAEEPLFTVPTRHLGPAGAIPNPHLLREIARIYDVGRRAGEEIGGHAARYQVRRALGLSG